MSETMLKRVAKAIYAKWEDRPNYAKLQMNGILAEELARAAIEAMREPSEAMNVGGLIGLVTEIERMNGPREPVVDGQELTDEQVANRYMNLGAIMRSSNEVEACWQAMIDAAC